MASINHHTNIKRKSSQQDERTTTIFLFVIIIHGQELITHHVLHVDECNATTILTVFVRSNSTPFVLKCLSVVTL
jgi:hypothetical protein